MRSLTSPHLRILIAILYSVQLEPAEAVSPDRDASLMLEHALFEGLGAPSQQQGEVAADGGGGEAPLLLADRLALACRFLPDEPLRAFLARLEGQCIARGALAGLALTGMTESALPLLQAYADRTADVQTLSLLILSASPGLLALPRPRRWLQAYRELLNRWSLFHERCLLDIAAGKAERASKREGKMDGSVELLSRPSQVFAHCTYCDASLQTSFGGRKQTAAATTGVRRRGGGKHLTCPRCAKPLPRCSVCLLHLGCLEAEQNAPDGASRGLEGDGAWGRVIGTDALDGVVPNVPPRWPRCASGRVVQHALGVPRLGLLVPVCVARSDALS